MQFQSYYCIRIVSPDFLEFIKSIHPSIPSNFWKEQYLGISWGYVFSPKKCISITMEMTDPSIAIIRLHGRLCRFHIINGGIDPATDDEGRLDFGMVLQVTLFRFVSFRVFFFLFVFFCFGGETSRSVKFQVVRG